MSNCINGFEWYLPLCFKDCIAQCKFEQGDIIYKNKPKGLSWADEIKDIDFLVQVKSPTRSNSSLVDNLDVFRTNWNTKIVFEKIYPNDKNQNKLIETTQGNFFTFLWKNDETIFSNNIIIPPVLTSISSKHIKSEFIKSQIPSNWSGFVTIADSVNNLIISKRNSISEVLMKNFNTQSLIFKVDEAVDIENFDNKNNSGFSPTLGVELFLIETDNLENVQELLKSILFKGLKDRFNITVHGQLFRN